MQPVNCITESETIILNVLDTYQLIQYDIIVITLKCRPF